MNFRDTVKQMLTVEEQAMLKTAFDAIGDIAILEIDEGLRRKEKKIAQALLGCHKNIVTVLRKDSAHEGEFRIQKYKFLAGQDKRETMHVESNTRLLLDVEKVYFSPRMSHERLRIASMAKPGENILVMFSGCGPYPCVLARNAKPSQVLGIEINPTGHLYAKKNAKLNKLKNVHFFQGDAAEVSASFGRRRIGLKTHHSQLGSRMKQKPPILELHLYYRDLFDSSLDKAISALKETEVVLHVPCNQEGIPFSLASNNRDVLARSIDTLKKLKALSRKHSLRYVIHPHTLIGKMDRDISVEILDANLKKYKDSRMMIENMPYAEMGAEVVVPLAKKHRIGLCIDVAHLYICRKSDEEFYTQIADVSELNPYFHIADSDMFRWSWDKPHTLPIGNGEIDFSRIVPYIREGIIEVVSNDEGKGTEMLQSYRKYKKMLQGFTDFDRILMPLPRGGENFLDSALSAARKGTVLHFYDFLHEDDFGQAHCKIKAACKKAGVKCRILRTVKCGQYSPRTYRICVDFKLL